MRQTSLTRVGLLAVAAAGGLFVVEPASESRAEPGPKGTPPCANCVCKRVEAWSPDGSTTATGRCKWNSGLLRYEPVVNARGLKVGAGCETNRPISASDMVRYATYYQVSQACTGPAEEKEFTHSDNPSHGDEVDRTKCNETDP